MALREMKAKYGLEFEKLNSLHEDQLSFTDFIDNFIDSDNVANASIDANANVKQKDICSLESEMSKAHKKLLSYNKIFYEITKKYGIEEAKKWFEGEWSGEFYLHDAYSASFKPYCFAYDLDRLVKEGMFFVGDNCGGAPKHLSTFVAHVKEFVSWTSNRTSGACGLPSFLVYAWYFWNKDIMDNYYLKNPAYYRDQCLQEFIYGLNQPYLRVNQCAFTNITIMDRNYLEELFGGREFPDGTFAIDHIDEIIDFQKAFMRVIEKIRKETMFTFPVLTYSLLYKDGKFVDEDFARWCSDHNTIWCDSNFFQSDNVTSLSSCCRLVNDFSGLKGFINSIGGTALRIGSVKVNTINLVRISYECSKRKDLYLEILRDRVATTIKVLDCVRHIIQRNIEKGILSNYEEGLIDMKNQYNTIGINGLYEAIRNLGCIQTDQFGNKSYTEEGFEFAKKILDTINEVKENMKKELNFDYSINVEAVPAERCAVILCEKDNLLYPNHNDDFIYSNQWIPLTVNARLADKLKLASVLDKKCGGGQILHINIDGQFPNKEMAWKTLNDIAKAGVIYFAFNNKISVCKNNHAFYGEVCDKCGEKKIDTFQRIVGYLVPSKSYSKERKKEFAKRYWHKLDDSLI